MQQSAKQKSSQKYFNTISKLLDCEYTYESKDSTREQLYQQIFKYKTNLRRDNHNLKRQIQQTKQRILSKALGLYFTELKQLNEHNKELREKHKLIYQTKKPIQYNTNVCQVSKSPLLTPRSRHSTANIFDNINDNNNNYNSLRPSIKGVKKIDTNNILNHRRSFNNENIQNIKPKRVYGRNSLKLSQAPRRTNQQLTQRKMISSLHQTQNCSQFVGTNLFNNVSTFSQTNSVHGSQKSRSKILQTKNTENIFMNFIETLLQQQKMKEQEIQKVMNLGKNNFGKHHQQNYVNNLEKQVQKTTNNIEKMQEILQKYELQIKKLQLNLSSTSNMTKQLTQIKQSCSVMKQKCKNIQLLRVQVANKQRKLKQIKNNGKTQIFDPPSSIKTLLRLFDIQQNSIHDPSKCKQQISNLVKGALEKPCKRKIKIKQLLDTIREGRKKFKQLMAVYETRIKKIEKKLVNLKFNQSKANLH